MASAAKERYTAWAEIDLGAVRHNYAEARRVAGGGEVLAAIKCNAYGHGAVEIARALAAEGVKFFGVSSAAEAIELREGGTGTDILNLGPFAPGEAALIVEHGIVQAVFRTWEAEALQKAAAAADGKARVHAKIDTGLSRLGVHHGEAAAFIEALVKLKHVRMEGVFSVLTEDPGFDAVQLERLKTVLGQIEDAGVPPGRVHLASSAAVIDFPESHLDMVRPGIMLLGIYPNERSKKEREVELIPALSLKARVARVARIPKGETVSYLRKYAVKEDTCIATLPVGYTHGYPRAAAGKAEVLIRGERYPVIADIPATAMFADLGVDGAVAEGDEVVLIGKQGDETVSADDLAAAAGISAYQVVAALSPALPRVYPD